MSRRSSNNISNTIIAWSDQGPEDGKPCATIIFLHAMAGSRTAWTPQIEHLSKRYRCIAWDMPGFGDSADLAPGANMTTVVQQLYIFIADTLQLKSAHLVGLSVGGMILQHFAAAHPSLARSLCLLDSSPKFAFGSDFKAEEFTHPIYTKLAAGMTPAAFSTQMVRAIVGPKCPEAVTIEIIASMSRARVSGLKLTTKLIAEHDAIDVLASIQCPTLVMAGQDDMETPPAYAFEIAKRIPGASVTIIADAGHIVNLEKPVQVTKRLEFFLEHQL